MDIYTESYYVTNCMACNDKTSNDLLNTSSIPATNIKQKRIWKQVRMPSSQYMDAKQAISVGYDTRNTLPWNQSSDRISASKSMNVVPSKGNSTLRSLTRLRPGASSAGGVGVDIKHNSYERYILKKKTKNLISEECGNKCKAPNYGNKYKMIGILGNCKKC